MTCHLMRLGLLLTFLLACSGQSVQPHRVGVRTVDGAGEFYLRDTGATFTPRGNNFIRLAPQEAIFGGSVTYHSTFNGGFYDVSDVEAVLTRMEADGYNTVRVFLSGVSLQGIGNPAGGLSLAYLTNVADFLQRAQSHGIFVQITFDFIPQTGGYYSLLRPTPDIASRNVFYLTSGGIAAMSRYFTDLVNGLTAVNAPLDTVFGWDLSNELSFDGAALPFILKLGRVATANGKTYDMASPESRQAMMDEGLIYFIDQVRSAIQKADPDALVTVSFFHPQGPNPARIGDTRLIRTFPAICCSTADFIDLHPYITELTLPQYVQNYELPALSAKPILMGEYGMLRNSGGSAENVAALLEQWQVDSCAFGFKGWLLWNWDILEQPDANYWSATVDGGIINDALKPSARPDPCRSTLPENLGRSASVSVSKEIPTQPAPYAVDGLTSTWWSAGAFPPQWIELKLSRPSTVKAIRLLISQFPAGRTIHRLYLRDHDGQLALLQEFDGVTSDNQILRWIPDVPLAGVEAIRIETSLGPSWVSWREIEVLSDDHGDPAITSIRR